MREFQDGDRISCIWMGDARISATLYDANNAYAYWPCHETAVLTLICPSYYHIPQTIGQIVAMRGFELRKVDYQDDMNNVKLRNEGTQNGKDYLLLGQEWTFILQGKLVL